MDPRIENELVAFHSRAELERERIDKMSREDLWAQIDEFLLPVGPMVGRFMNILVKCSGAQTIVEMGTSHGYSTLWLAEAAQATGGRVYSYDTHAQKQEYARYVLARVGLAEQVEFVLGDGHQRVQELMAPIDFTLIDHWESLYCSCFEALRPNLAAGAIIVADNVTYPEDTEGHVLAYRNLVAAMPGMISAMLDIGNGIELSRLSNW